MGALLVGAAMQVLIPLAPPVPAVAMAFLVGTQVVGDGALTVYLVNETTLRQRLLPPEALGRAAAAWQVANGLLTPVGALAGARPRRNDRHAPDAVRAGGRALRRGAVPVHRGPHAARRRCRVIRRQSRPAATRSRNAVFSTLPALFFGSSAKNA